MSGREQCKGGTPRECFYELNLTAMSCPSLTVSCGLLIICCKLLKLRNTRNSRPVWLFEFTNLMEEKVCEMVVMFL